MSPFELHLSLSAMPLSSILMSFFFLRMPTAELTSLEIYVWPNGISVWLPYPGKSDYVVLDAQDEEIGRI